MAAFLGSLVSRIEDVQQMITPIIEKRIEGKSRKDMDCGFLIQEYRYVEWNLSKMDKTL